MNETVLHSTPYLPRSEAADSNEVAPNTGDRALTANRRELKYCVPPRRLTELTPALDSHLERYRFTGAGATRLPGANFWSTTIYFDTSDQQLYRQILTGNRQTKIRAREYYTFHPALTEIATSPEQLVRYGSNVWLEVKTRDQSRVRKHRMVIPKQDLHKFMLSPCATEELLAIQPGYEQDEVSASSQVAAVVAQCKKYVPLLPQLVVNYQRMSWQDKSGSLRLTLDRRVSFFEPQPDLWTRKTALERSSLGEAREDFLQYILEVKTLGSELPSWLTKALQGVELEASEMSKFATGMDALYPR